MASIGIDVYANTKPAEASINAMLKKIESGPKQAKVTVDPQVKQQEQILIQRLKFEQQAFKEREASAQRSAAIQQKAAEQSTINQIKEAQRVFVEKQKATVKEEALANKKAAVEAAAAQKSSAIQQKAAEQSTINQIKEAQRVFVEKQKIAAKEEALANKKAVAEALAAKRAADAKLREEARAAAVAAKAARPSGSSSRSELGQFAISEIAGAAAELAGLPAIFGRLNGAIGGTAAAIFGIVGSMAALAKQGEISRKVLQNFGLTASQANSTFESLRDISSKTGADVSELTKTFGRLNAAQHNTGLSQAGLLEATKGISAGLKAFGAEAAQTQSFLLQFSQSIGSGRVQADEFNSMIESAGPLLDYIARKLLGPTSNARQLQDALKVGKITLQQFTSEFARSAPELEKMAMNVGGLSLATNKFVNSLQKLAESLGVNKLVDVLAASLEHLSIIMDDLAENDLVVGVTSENIKNSKRYVELTLLQTDLQKRINSIDPNKAGKGQLENLKNYQIQLKAVGDRLKELQVEQKKASEKPAQLVGPVAPTSEITTLNAELAAAKELDEIKKVQIDRETKINAIRAQGLLPAEESIRIQIEQANAAQKISDINERLANQAEQEAKKLSEKDTRRKAQLLDSQEELAVSQATTSLEEEIISHEYEILRINQEITDEQIKQNLLAAENNSHKKLAAELRKQEIEDLQNEREKANVAILDAPEAAQRGVATDKARKEFEKINEETKKFNDTVHGEILTGAQAVADTIAQWAVGMNQNVSIGKQLLAIMVQVIGQIAIASATRAFAGGLASGGTASAGSMYRVGEQGPEMFSARGKNYMIPGETGTVTPNNRLKPAYGGGRKVVVNNYAGAEVQVTRNDDEIIEVAVTRAVSAARRDFAQSVGSGYGEYAQSMNRSFDVRRKT